MIATYKRRVRPRLSDTGEKVRNVICLIYIEDLEACGATYGDLLAYLDSLHMEACVSPIHDRDCFTADDVWKWCERHIDPETGDLDIKYVDDAPYVGKPKKPHCHLLLKNTAQQNAFWYSDLLSGVVDIRPSLWDKCVSVTGSMRYWAHMDSPEKAQYSPMGIHGFGGIDMSCLMKRDETTNVALAAAVHDMVTQHNCRYFHELVDLAYEVGDVDLVSYLRGQGAFWSNYMNSRAAKRRDEFAKRARNNVENSGCGAY